MRNFDMIPTDGAVRQRRTFVDINIYTLKILHRRNCSKQLINLECAKQNYKCSLQNQNSKECH